MAKLTKIFLLFVGLIICVQSDVVQLQNENVEFWGDLTTKIILGSSRAKTGFPFITRSFEVTYPEEFETKENAGIVRGIKHSNSLPDSNCRPEVRVTNGGINTRSATVKVTSKRGCGLDSNVEFFIQK